MTGLAFDVLVIGEPLIELAAAEPLETATEFRLGFAGDALNVAAAASGAGARTALLTRLGDDLLGGRLHDVIAGLGIDTQLIRRDRAPTGAYLVGADPSGKRPFAYLRQGSAASRLSPTDLDFDVLRASRVLVLSGITSALSATCAETVQVAAEAVAAAGGQVVYDPNFRPRLTTRRAAREALAAIAPFSSVVLPSAPAETTALLDTHDPVLAAARVRRLGGRAAVVTCGPNGAVLDDGSGPRRITAVPVDEVVDQTGAGDAFAGALAAGLAHNQPLEACARAGTRAGATRLTGLGGSGVSRTAATP
jgi:2-dehydro-3-deoxygluconokinase